jgi:hypothetical protein
MHLIMWARTSFSFSIKSLKTIWRWFFSVQAWKSCSCALVWKRVYTCLNYGAELFALQMNFIGLQLHYLNCGWIAVLYLNYSKITAALLALRLNCGSIAMWVFALQPKKSKKFTFWQTSKLLIWLKKNPTDHYISFLCLFAPERSFLCLFGKHKLFIRKLPQNNLKIYFVLHFCPISLELIVK